MKQPDATRERTGRVEVYRDEQSAPASVWASCDLQSGERMEILTEVEALIDVENVPHGTTVGEVRIVDGDIEFTPRETVISDFGHED